MCTAEARPDVLEDRRRARPTGKAHSITYVAPGGRALRRYNGAYGPRRLQL